MISISSKDNLEFSVAPKKIDGTWTNYPQLKVLELDEYANFYVLKMEGIDITIRAVTQADDYYNTDFTTDVVTLGSCNCIFMVKVPKYYFNYLAKDKTFPLGSEDLTEIDLLKYSVNDYVSCSDSKDSFGKIYLEQILAQGNIAEQLSKWNNISYSIHLS